MGVDPDGMKFNYSLVAKGEVESLKLAMETAKKLDPDGVGKMIKALEDSDEEHFITITDARSGVQATPYAIANQRDKKTEDKDVYKAVKGLPAGTLINLNRADFEAASHELDNTEGNALTLIAHEFWHAYRYDNGKSALVVPDREEELGAIKMGNRIRDALGIIRRNTYGGMHNYSKEELDEDIEWYKKNPN